MNGYLVDTNIPSELIRPRPEPGVEAFLRQAGKDRVYLSVLSLGEIIISGIFRVISVIRDTRV